MARPCRPPARCRAISSGPRSTRSSRTSRVGRSTRCSASRARRLGGQAGLQRGAVPAHAGRARGHRRGRGGPAALPGRRGVGAAGRAGRTATTSPPSRLLPGNGVDSLIKLLCLTVLDPGDALVMAWPSFPSWRQGALIQGAEVISAPLAADGGYDLDALLDAITAPHQARRGGEPQQPDRPGGGRRRPGGVPRPPARARAAGPRRGLLRVPAPGGHDGVALVRDGRPLVVCAPSARSTASPACASAG